MAHQSQSNDEARERVDAHTVEEGDDVFMGVSLHGTSGKFDGVEYDEDVLSAGVEGVVTEAPRKSDREMMKDGKRPVVDFTVETDDGVRYTWNVDNGYVIGPHPDLGRRTDVGKFSGFYK